MTERTIGRYRLESLIGEGGMGRVYRAFDSVLARPVALKILPSAVVSDPSRVSRFIQEARAASALNHPHVVTIYDIGEEHAEGEAESVRFIAMELIDGTTLRDLIGTNRLDLRRGLKIAGQVAEALAAAHAVGIIHRDLKPENIMVNAAGAAKVLDFGLAKLRPDESGNSDDSRTMEKASDPGTVLGTVGYMSPEQAQGHPVDARTDVFSLGCVLYEIATGRRAFRGDSSIDTLHKIIYSEPEPMRALLPDAPSELARIVRKALAKDPDDRYQSVKDLAIDLRDLIREIDSNPSGASLAGMPPPPARKRGMVVPIAIVAAMLVIAAVAVIFLRRRPAAAATKVPVSVQMTRLTANGKVIAAAISPDGKYVVYVVSDQGEQVLAVRQLASGQSLTLIPARRTAYWGMTFAPDSASIYYGIKDSTTPAGTVFQISTLGGAPRRIIDDIDSAIAFSPDGSKITFTRARYPTAERSAVMVARADGGDARALISVPAPQFFAPVFFAGPSWSPDGRLIAASVIDLQTRKAWIVAADTASGATRTIATPPWRIAAQVAWMPDQSGLLAIAQNQQRSRSQVWWVPYPTGEAQPVTNDLFDYRIVSLSADGKSLVTVASDAASDVWVCRDGALPKRLNASKREGIYGLAPLADGHLIITSIEAGKFDLWLENEDGSGRTLLTRDENVNRFPAATPDGQTIVYLSETSSTNEICRMSRDGSDRKVLARTALNGAALALSPDGKWVVYEDLFTSAASPGHGGVVGLMRVPTDGGTATRVSDEALSTPAFSPDGTKLAARLDDPASSRAFLVTLPAGGGPVTRVMEWDSTSSSTVCWTADAKALVVNTMPGDRANLWRIPLDGRPPERITSFDEHTAFMFRPLRNGSGWVISRGDLSRDALLLTGFRPQ